VSLEALAGGDTLTKLSGAVVILWWLALARRGRNVVNVLGEDRPWFSYLVVLFLGWASVSALWADDTGATIAFMTSLIPVALLLPVAYSAIHTPSDMRLVLWAFVLGAFATTVFGLVTGLAYKDRLIGGIGNPNGLAAALVPAVVVAAALAVTSTRWSARLFALLTVGTSVIGIFMTQSRGATVGLVVGLLAATLIGGALRPHAIALTLIVAAVGVTYFFAFATQAEQQRLSNISAEGSSSRTDAWQLALQITRDYPVTGVGLGNFQATEPLYVVEDVNLLQIGTILSKNPVTHNAYLQTLAELGIVGLALLLSVVGGALALGHRAVRRLAVSRDASTEVLGRSVLISVIALAVVYVFQDALLEKEWWLMMGVLLALGPLADRALERNAARPPRPQLVRDHA
jgi:O-antigen ligase